MPFGPRFDDQIERHEHHHGEGDEDPGQGGEQ
jgi:hypothetical protein